MLVKFFGGGGRQATNKNLVFGGNCFGGLVHGIDGVAFFDRLQDEAPDPVKLFLELFQRHNENFSDSRLYLKLHQALVATHLVQKLLRHRNRLKSLRVVRHTLFTFLIDLVNFVNFLINHRLYFELKVE